MAINRVCHINDKTIKTLLKEKRRFQCKELVGLFIEITEAQFKKKSMTRHLDGFFRPFDQHTDLDVF